MAEIDQEGDKLLMWDALQTQFRVFEASFNRLPEHRKAIAGVMLRHGLALYDSVEDDGSYEGYVVMRDRVDREHPFPTDFHEVE